MFENDCTIFVVTIIKYGANKNCGLNNVKKTKRENLDQIIIYNYDLFALVTIARRQES